MHLAKRKPLGDLIMLDRERCIQCGRCVRFQDEIVDDPVIAFAQRGRGLEIVTFSEPGFDSYFSGNTTDICPVGALTTVDFRFGARPWELNAAASICPHCPVGCNLTLNTRREAQAGGREVIKRVMPRQNEAVNELWICDKGRLAHHFATSPARITRPLVRREERLVETTWNEALARAMGGLRLAGTHVVGLAGGRASNEDLFNFRFLIEGLGGHAFLDDPMAGGDLVRQVGVGKGTNLARLGRGDAVLVIAADLHEEAPIWWLRVKQAADRGASVVVANLRSTRLERYAAHVIRYGPGRAVQAALGLLHAAAPEPALEEFAGDDSIRRAGKALAEAKNLVIFFGREGLDLAGTDALARACGALLATTRHVGRADNGLIGVWPRANTQGAWDLGLRPDPAGRRAALVDAQAVCVMAADPIGDDPVSAELLRGKFLIVQELFLTPTAKSADVVLPAESFVEREGSLTTGERRVQRFYPAVAVLGEAWPDWRIAAEIGKRLGIVLEDTSAAAVLARIAATVEDYAGLTYQGLASVAPQWPEVGGPDLYYGGTAYKNEQGMGIALGSTAEGGKTPEVTWAKPADRPETDGLLLIPVTRLFDRGTTVLPSGLLERHLAGPEVWIHPEEARRLGVADGDLLDVRWPGGEARVVARLGAAAPERALLLPRSVGIPLAGPVAVEARAVAEAVRP
jgi:NADH-quinone oxidoreductase subunit G